VDPLAPWSIVRVHAIISAALNLAVRYDWIDYNPAERATRPRLRKREPNPSSPRDAARLLNHVWQGVAGSLGEEGEAVAVRVEQQELPASGAVFAWFGRRG
jgi:hypothetical protein